MAFQESRLETGFERVSTRESQEPLADIIASGRMNLPNVSAIAEYRVENRHRLLQPNGPQFSPSIQELKSSRTLALASIASDVALEPYWNAACQELQSVLWCPVEIGLPDPVSTSSSGPLSCTVAPLSNWKRVIKNLSSTQQGLSVSLPASSPAITGKEAVVARKVRVFPKSDPQWRDAASLHRRAYNLAIEAIKGGKPDQTTLRIEIREKVKSERELSGRLFVATICDEAVNSAFDTLYKCVAKWKKGEKASLKFRSIRDVKQGFVVQRCATNGQILPRFFGNTYISEDIENDVRGQTVRVTLIRGRWFVSFHQTLVLADTQGGNKLAAIDPGVRTFATVYGLEDCLKYGDGFSRHIQSLSDKHDFWRSLRDRLPRGSQWAKDRFVWVSKKLNKIANRMHDLIDDLHRRVAFDLVSTFDILLLPTFETSQMSKRSKGRKIRKGTVRSLLSLSFYKFSQHLAWMCKKYGKMLVRVNEAYTSKTDSRTGEGVNLGGAKKINGFDRDINGARGILLRALTR